MKIVALYSAGTTVSWQTARRRNTFHPVPLCPHPSVYPSVYVHFTTERNGTERKRKRINESTTNTRVEEWLIENLYHPVWYSFISGIRVLSIRITYVHNFARKHASYGQIFFSLSLSFSPRYPRGTIETFLDWISDRAEVRFSEERVPSSVINILTIVRGKVMLLFLAMTGMKL